MNQEHDMLARDAAEVADAPAHVQTDDTAKSNQPSEARTRQPRDAWKDLKTAAGNLFLTARYHTIRALPGYIVNNSTNILGATHVMTEMMMFKASGANAKLIENPKNPINWVWEPLKNVFAGTFKYAKIQDVDKSLLPSTGNAAADVFEVVTDTKKATQRELSRQEQDQIKNNEKKLATKHKKLVSTYRSELNSSSKPLLDSFGSTYKAQVEERFLRRFGNAAGTETAIALNREVKTDKALTRYLERTAQHEIVSRIDKNRAKYAAELRNGKDEYVEKLTAENKTKSPKERDKAIKAIESELEDISGGPVYSKMRLANPWQMRSTFAGLVVWALSAVIPDKKESDEEVERLAILKSTNLSAYVVERFREAIWIPQWASHKRQMIGLGIMISGVCSLLGSFRNRKTLLTAEEGIGEFVNLLHDKKMLEPGGAGRIDEVISNTVEASKVFAQKKKLMSFEYEFNPSYFATSLLTFISSLPLLFASDNERGFAGFGGFMTGRLAFLFSSIGKKFHDKEPGAGWYTAGMVSFQAENWAQALAGGAEKKKDPVTGEEVIVDHDDERRAAKEKSAQIKALRETMKKEVKETPATRVTGIAKHEMALPEQVSMQVKQQEMVV